MAKKLKLNKKTIARLNNNEMGNVKGGIGSDGTTCCRTREEDTCANPTGSIGCAITTGCNYITILGTCHCIDIPTEI